MGKCGFFMAAACATRLPHPRPGRAVAVGPRRLLIRPGKPSLFRSKPPHLEAVPQVCGLDAGGSMMQLQFYHTNSTVGRCKLAIKRVPGIQSYSLKATTTMLFALYTDIRASVRHV